MTTPNIYTRVGKMWTNEVNQIHVGPIAELPISEKAIDTLEGVLEDMYLHTNNFIHFRDVIDQDVIIKKRWAAELTFKDLNNICEIIKIYRIQNQLELGIFGIVKLSDLNMQKYNIKKDPWIHPNKDINHSPHPHVLEPEYCIGGPVETAIKDYFEKHQKIDLNEIAKQITLPHMITTACLEIMLCKLWRCTRKQPLGYYGLVEVDVKDIPLMEFWRYGGETYSQKEMVGVFSYNCFFHPDGSEWERVGPRGLLYKIGGEE
jgi:hypothetical protein